MVDRNRPNRPRPPRPQGAPSGPAAPGAEGAAPAAAQRAVPPSNYREHLEAEHGVRVVEEAGWPTEVKRYYVVREKDGKEERLVSFVGTLPRALAHFYHYFHPQPPRPRPSR